MIWVSAFYKHFAPPERTAAPASARRAAVPSARQSRGQWLRLEATFNFVTVDCLLRREPPTQPGAGLRGRGGSRDADAGYAPRRSWLPPRRETSSRGRECFGFLISNAPRQRSSSFPDR